MKGHLLDKIEKTFSSTPSTFSAIKNIADDIVNTGLPIDECALLQGVNQEQLATLYSLSPDTKQYLELKRLEYKANTLRLIHKNAKDKQDVKTLLSLMERYFPNDYNPTIQRLNAQNDLNPDKEDKLVQIFQFIQSSDTTPQLINKHAHITDSYDEPALPEAVESPLSPLMRHE